MDQRKTGIRDIGFTNVFIIHEAMNVFELVCLSWIMITSTNVSENASGKAS